MSKPLARAASAILSIALIAFTFSACLNQSVEPNDSEHVYEEAYGTTAPVIRGTVTDAQGQPLAGVAVVLTYVISFAPDGAGERPRAAIEFALPETQPVKVWIERPCGPEIVRLLVDGDYAAGMHTVIWDGRDDDGLGVIDGHDIAHVDCESFTATQDLFLAQRVYFPDAQPDEYERLATTDAEGRFTISEACLDFGYVVRDAESNEIVTVTRDVQVWALHAELPTARSGEIAVHPSLATEVAIQFAE